MSVQRIKLNRRLQSTHGNTKKAMIEALIKQKIEQQLPVVKKNVQKVLERQQDKYNDKYGQQSDMKVKGNVKDTLLSMDRIRKSLSFNPVACYSDNQASNFISTRQTDSPLIHRQTLQKLQRARSQSQNFMIKLKETDRHDYESKEGKNMHYFNVLQRNIRTSMDNQLWFPAIAEVDSLVESRETSRRTIVRESQQEGKKTFHKRSISSRLQFRDQHNEPVALYVQTQGQKNKQIHFEPVIIYHSVNDKKPRLSLDSMSRRQQITYESKKYHKDDYLSLQKWLRTSIEAINQLRHPPQHPTLPSMSISEHLNKIYATYMCGWKQLIRLTYVQSSEKGLLVEELLWSTIRLFRSIVEQQHRINQEDFRQHCQEGKEFRELYESRIERLESALKYYQTMQDKMNKIQHRLVISYASYRKLSEELVKQLQGVMKQRKQIQAENKYINNRFVRILKEFSERGIIKHSLGNTGDSVYYYLNWKNEVEVLGKISQKGVELENQLRQKRKEEGTGEKEVEEKLENELNRFWRLKSGQEEFRSIVDGLDAMEFVDGIVQVEGGPYQTVVFGGQFPEQAEEVLLKVLRKQLNDLRKQKQQQQRVFAERLDSLSKSNEGLINTIEQLTVGNKKQKQQLQQKQDKINSLITIIDNNKQGQAVLKEKISLLEQALQERGAEWRRKQAEMQEKLMSLQQQSDNQQDNIRRILASTLALQEQKNAFANKLASLESNLNALSPLLQKYIELVQSYQQGNFFKNLSISLQTHLSDYIQRDTRLFLTK